MFVSSCSCSSMEVGWPNTWATYSSLVCNHKTNIRSYNWKKIYMVCECLIIIQLVSLRGTYSILFTNYVHYKKQYWRFVCRDLTEMRLWIVIHRLYTHGLEKRVRRTFCYRRWPKLEDRCVWPFLSTRTKKTTAIFKLNFNSFEN